MSNRPAQPLQPPQPGEPKAQPQISAMVPASADPFAEALRQQHAAAADGFDWTEESDLWDKLDEEIGELRAATDPAHRLEELGDLLFMVVNLARHLGLDPATALAAATAKFAQRYAFIDARRETLPPLGDPERIVRMEMLWQAAKAKERQT